MKLASMMDLLATTYSLNEINNQRKTMKNEDLIEDLRHKIAIEKSKHAFTRQILDNMFFHQQVCIDSFKKLGMDTLAASDQAYLDIMKKNIKERCDE